MSRSPPPARASRPKRTADRERTAYLVLGMHRSGTSAVTQLLALAGCQLPANVMPGDEHNAKGYFEPWKIATFNDERLRAAGSAWDDPFAYPFHPLPDAAAADWQARAGALFDEEFGAAATPLMKDPRVTVLMPMWRQVLTERAIAARAVIPLRHPLAVAGSLRRRDGFSTRKSALVWSAYMLAAEAYTRDMPRAVVGYDALLADWRAEVARVEAAHGAPLPKLTVAAGKAVDRFLTPDLRHNAGDAAGLESLGWAGEIAQTVYDAFSAAAAGGPLDAARLDAAAARLAERQADFGDLVSPAASDRAAARAELAEAEGRIAVLQSLEAELRADLQRTRDELEAGWRADVKRLDKVVSEQGWALERITAAIDGALPND